VFVVAAVFYGGHRIRSTLEPVVVVCAAVALVAAWDFARQVPARGDSDPDAPRGSAK
jgi:hypothetical protein